MSASDEEQNVETCGEENRRLAERAAVPSPHLTSSVASALLHQSGVSPSESPSARRIEPVLFTTSVTAALKSIPDSMITQSPDAQAS